MHSVSYVAAINITINRLLFLTLFARKHVTKYRGI